MSPSNIAGLSMKHPVRIALITGYLGAGKTTLLNNILSNEQGVRAAVIVNDIGEVNIDASLIERGGVVSQVDDTLVPLSNGCICCTLADDLYKQLISLAESGRYDHIIIEASGICEPVPISYTIDNFCKTEAARGLYTTLDNIIAVVDCARMNDEFNGGKDLLDEDLEEDDIENLLIQQIEFCTTLVLNKTDLVTPEQVGELKALVRALQKNAKIIEAVNGQVDVAEVLNTDRFDFDEAYRSAAWIDALENPEEYEDHDDDHDEDEHDHEHDEHEHHHHDHDDDDDEHEHHHHDHDDDDDDEHEHHHHDHDHDDDDDDEHEHHHHDDDDDDDDHDDHKGGHGHHHHHHHHHHGPETLEYDVTTFIYERRKPFGLEPLQELAGNWPDSVIRAKGLAWINENPDMALMFEQAGRHITLTENGRFVASAPEEERERILEANPDLAKDWDPELGDRMIKMVIIGRHMDRAAVEAALDACLVDWNPQA